MLNWLASCETELHPDNDVVEIKRYGAKVDNNKRHLLIKFSTGQKKADILDNLSNLRDSTMKHISVQHDMTQTQRAELKELLDEAKAKERESGVGGRGGGGGIQGERAPWARKIISFKARR